MTKLLSPRDIVQSHLCIGCGSCAGQADPDKTGMKMDAYGELKPAGPKSWYQQRTAQFTATCPFSPQALNEDELADRLYPGTAFQDAALGHFQTAYVGYAAEEDFRLQGSSGGMVSWVARELLKKNLVDGVAHVVAVKDPQPGGRFFQYRISRTEDEIREGAKSRYYPVDLAEVLSLIRAVPGRYAVVGIPCFIKAVQLLRQTDPLYRERICFTLGLFCGHMKSARFVESFAWQMQVPVSEIKQVEFRHKDPSRPANWYNARLTLRDGQVVHKDWWHLGDGDWGAGFFMNAACNFCDDVVAETADISFGDAWVEPYSSDGKGTNVVVVRSKIVEKLVADAISEKRLQLDAVDARFVEQTQAAGFRQRREGLAYRLTWWRKGVQPRKRVAPGEHKPIGRRKLIYRMRFQISAWCHPVFLLARRVKAPSLYIRWARFSLALYQGLAYHHGRIGAFIKKLGAERE